MTQDELLELSMEKPLYGGDCLSHHQGKAVFIPFALPGETVRARIAHQKRRFNHAEIDSLIQISSARCEPKCIHFSHCGGCQYQHADYPGQLAMKQLILREIMLRERVPIPATIGLLSGNPWEYRNRIRLALGTNNGSSSIQFGYRSRASHDIVPITECPIAAPMLVRVASRVEQCLSQSPPPVAVNELEVFTNATEDQVLVTLHSASASSRETQAWVESMFCELGPPVTGLRIVSKTESGQRERLDQSGEESLFYSVANTRYAVQHNAFFQVNRWILEDFVSLVTANRRGRQAWDLFAGVGLFARRLEQTFECVTAVESSPASFVSLEKSLTNASSRAVCSTTLQFLQQNRDRREPGPDCIVLDPPRAGLGQQTCTLLAAIHAPQMVYVSCDPATLARDLKMLTAERYTIANITLVDMFPQTYHLETVVSLVRA